MRWTFHLKNRTKRGIFSILFKRRGNERLLLLKQNYITENYTVGAEFTPMPSLRINGPRLIGYSFLVAGYFRKILMKLEIPTSSTTLHHISASKQSSFPVNQILLRVISEKMIEGPNPLLIKYATQSYNDFPN